jgi:dTDP-4-amino-4,6-dideoxygalactose transaminase
VSDAESIPLLDLAAQNHPLLPAFREAFERVATRGQFILGPEVESFERAIADHLGVKHAIGVSSGTDALLVALMALGVGPGDEVVTTPFSFFATAGCIARVGATPVFVDVDPATFNIDVSRVAGAITPRTRAIMPVHLFGQPCAMKELQAIACEHGLPIIEDAAQAIGARTAIGPVGGLGALAAFSFFPSKNLGAFGDAGLVTTNDAALAARVRLLRSHGAEPKYYNLEVGGNFRLDALQAAILAVKLPYLEGWARARAENARAYTEAFEAAGLPPSVLSLPTAVEEGHVWNQYTLRTPRRDALRAHLASRGIGSEVYYPVPLHRQQCFAELGYSEGRFPEAERCAREAISLPIFPELGAARRARVAQEVISALQAV